MNIFHIFVSILIALPSLGYCELRLEEARRLVDYGRPLEPTEGYCTPDSSLDKQPQFCSFQNGLSPAAWNVIRSTVQVKAVGSNRKVTNAGPGSGFIVDISSDKKTALIATSQHVVRDCKTFECRINVIISRSDNPEKLTRTSGYVVETDDAHDTALIKIEIPKDVILEELELADANFSPSTNQILFASGYPSVGDRRKWTVAKPHPKGNHKRISRGYIQKDHPEFLFTYTKDASVFDSKKGTPANSINRVFLHSIDNLPGSSGGPVFTEDGIVLAIVTKASKGNKKFAYCWNLKEMALGTCYNQAISIVYLKDMLARNRLN